MSESTQSSKGLLEELKALVALLFDFSFKEFLTPRLVRMIYALSLVVALVSALAWMFSGFQVGILYGFFTLVTGPVAFAVYVLGARVMMELVLAVFRIAEHVERLPMVVDVTEKKRNYE
jgi:uncharacterized membrane protein